MSDPGAGRYSCPWCRERLDFMPDLCVSTLGDVPRLTCNTHVRNVAPERWWSARADGYRVTFNGPLEVLAGPPARRLQVYTGRIPQPQRRIDGYAGPDALNVSRSSGSEMGHAFAPSVALLAEVNRRKRAAKGDEAALVEAWRWYEPLFLAEMRGSYRTHRATWERLLSWQSVTLACYCGTAHRCHRRILAAIILPKLGAIDCGERPTSPNPSTTTTTEARP